jgi:hypothetical protein
MHDRHVSGGSASTGSGSTCHSARYSALGEAMNGTPRAAYSIPFSHDFAALKALSANGTRPTSRSATCLGYAPRRSAHGRTRPFTPNACSVSPTPHDTNRAPVSASTPGSTPPITSRSPTWVTTDPVHPTVGASTLGAWVGTDRYEAGTRFGRTATRPWAPYRSASAGVVTVTRSARSHALRNHIRL